MGIYIFKTEFLRDVLIENCGPHGDSDFGSHIIPKLIDKYKVYAYRFNDYWRDVGTIDEYWKSNIELTLENPPVSLYEETFKIYTKSEELPPVKFRNAGSAKDSLVSNGCIIKGVVENSVISPGVIIEDGAVVKNSVVFNDTIIKKGSVIDRAIIDKKVVVGENCIIGVGRDYTPNLEEPKKLFSGLNIIAKFAHIPPSVIIERNCRIMSRVSEADFKGKKHISSGETIHSKREGGVFEIIL
jgi:glucose-1-phosphate adenylyltransferase